MKTMKQNLFILFFLTLLTGLFAQENPWEQKGIKIKETLSQKKTTFILEDSQQRNFKVTAERAISSNDVEQILGIRNTFLALKSIQIDSLEFILSDKGIYVILVPSELEYQKKDLLDFLPSGISFLYADGKLTYHFPILKDKNLIKVKGDWKDEDELLRNILQLSEIKALSPAIVQKEQKDEQFLSEIVEKEKKREEDIKSGKAQEPVKEDNGFLAQKNAQRALIANQEKKKLVLYPKMRVTLGTGSLLSVSYPSVQYWKFELMPSLGLVYDQKKDLSDDKTELIDRGILACPMGLKLYFHFLSSEIFGMYGFTGGLYSLGISHYENRTLLMAGLGQVLYQYFFVEAGWIYNKEANGLVVGLGVQWKF